MVVPLGFAMWIAHFLFHFFTASHTPLPDRPSRCNDKLKDRLYWTLASIVYLFYRLRAGPFSLALSVIAAFINKRANAGQNASSGGR